MKQILLILAVVALVGCGERSSNDVEALKAENEKLRAETEAARLKAENAQLRAALANNSVTGDMKTCYWCKESIKEAAQICKHCGKNPSSPSVQAIERAIRKAAYKTTGKLTKEDFEKLTELALRTQITDAGLKEVAKLTQLKTLWLYSPRISDKGLKEVAKLQHLSELGLNLNFSNITDVGLKELAKLKQITMLNLDSKITDGGLKEACKMKQLTSLHLGSEITDAGLKEVVKLTQLKTLWLYSPRISDKGLKEVAKLKQLIKLELFECKQITGAGLKEVAKLRQLTSLRMFDCEQITGADLAALRKALPKCEIYARGWYTDQNTTNPTPAKELTLEEKVAGTYGPPIRRRGDAWDSLVFLGNGIVEAYKEKAKWKIVHGEIHTKFDDVPIIVWRINKDGSITHIAEIKGEKRVDRPKEHQTTREKIK